MEQQVAPAELLKFLQAEAETLQQLQAKISNELHHLQVEEEVFIRTLDRLNQNAANNHSSSTQGSSGEGTTTRQAGVELLDALQQELALAIPPVSTLPADSGPQTVPVHPVTSLPKESNSPTSLQAITATETVDDKNMPVKTQVGSMFVLKNCMTIFVA